MAMVMLLERKRTISQLVERRCEGKKKGERTNLSANNLKAVVRVPRPMQ